MQKSQEIAPGHRIGIARINIFRIGYVQGSMGAISKHATRFDVGAASSLIAKSTILDYRAKGLVTRLRRWMKRGFDFACEIANAKLARYARNRGCSLASTIIKWIIF